MGHTCKRTESKVRGSMISSHYFNQISSQLFVSKEQQAAHTQQLTNDAFSEKWLAYDNEDIREQEKLFDFQKNWFLSLYGFSSFDELQARLADCDVIVDAGCGLGYKAAWLAELAPHATIIAIDFSNAVEVAHKNYASLYPNIIFVKGDISETYLSEASCDIVICDQVIMHTQDPTKTLKELARITKLTGEVFCYWYRKKAMPRELLDEHFRSYATGLSHDELWQLSDEVLQLGKMLSELKVKAHFPDLPTLGIKGGDMDLQRFIYWNFIKCFWNEELGYQTSLSTNFDWYSPANARRFSKQDVYAELEAASLKASYFHEEEACYAGRFSRKS